MLESLFVWQLCFLNKPLYFINKIYFHTHLEWGGDAKETNFPFPIATLYFMNSKEKMLLQRKHNIEYIVGNRIEKSFLFK